MTFARWSLPAALILGVIVAGPALAAADGTKSEAVVAAQGAGNFGQPLRLAEDQTTPPTQHKHKHKHKQDQKKSSGHKSKAKDKTQ